MRFIAAIVVFAISAILLVVGVSFKILSGTAALETSADLSDVEVSYVVVDGSILRTNPGLQTVALSGGTDSFIGYGRTSDVVGWLGDSVYATLRYDPEQNLLAVAEIVSPAPPEPTDDTNAEGETPAPAEDKKNEQTVTNPSGSDLWLDERIGKATATLNVNVSADMSVLLAGSGSDLVPPSLSLSWPLPQPTFLWMNDDNLIFLGGGLAVIGLLLYLWALSHWSSQQGPRRRGRMPKPPRPRRFKPQDTPSITAPPRGRRAVRRGTPLIAVVVGAVLVSSLTACSSPYETGAVDETPTPTDTVVPEEALPPVVTEGQLKRILNEISSVVGQADETSDKSLLASRMTGGALATRYANYNMRANDSSIAPLPPLGDLPLTFVMPQAATTWPRSVIVVSQDAKKSDSPTVALVLVQETARENFKIEYLVTLEPDAYVPETAPPEIGSPVVAPDTKLLVLPPQDVALAYGDVLLRGEASEYFPLFDITTDTLVPQVGHDYKANKAASIADKAAVAFAEVKGAGQDRALATLDSGAIVAVTLDEVEQVTPLVSGAAVIPEGQQKALLGTNATSGIRSVYTLQLMFYVPPVGSDQKIRLLGFTQGLTAASVGG